MPIELHEENGGKLLAVHISGKLTKSDYKDLNEIKPSPHQHGDPNGGPISPNSRPYWTRAHRDWRVWVGVVLMLAAMVIYLMTNDLAWGPHLQPRQPISIPSGN